MQAGFDQEFSTLPPEQRDLFDHGRRDCCLRLMSSGQLKPSAEEELASWLSVYQMSRDIVERGIIEVHDHD